MKKKVERNQVVTDQATVEAIVLWKLCVHKNKPSKKDIVASEDLSSNASTNLIKNVAQS